DRVAELASVLQGGDGIIGVMGSGVRATWSTNGKSETWWYRLHSGDVKDTMTVFLDYSPLAKLQPPFKGRAVDEVIGYAAHEGGHCLWSDGDCRTTVTGLMQNLPRFGSVPVPVTPKRRRKGSKVSPLPVAPATGIIPSDAEVKEALRVLNIIEDAYIDYHVGEEWPVLGEYIQWSRKRIHKDRPIDYSEIAIQENPSRNHVMNLWIACSLYNAEVPEKMSDSIGLALNILLKASIQAVKTASSDERCGIAVMCWDCLQQFPNTADPLPKEPEKPKEPDKQEPEDTEEKPEDPGQDKEPEKDQKPEDTEQKPEGEESDEKPEGDGKGEPCEDGEDGDEGEGGDGDESDGGESGGDGDESEGDGKQSDGDGKQSDDEGDESDGDGHGDGQVEGEGDDGDGQGEGQGDGQGGVPEDEGQEFGPKGGESDDEAETEEKGDGQGGEDKTETEETETKPEEGGDGQGQVGNLDDFDLRDIEGLPEELLEKVIDAIAHELEDLSKSVSLAMGSYCTAQTKKADYDGPAAQKVRERVEPEIAELRRLFQHQKMEASRNLSGLNVGKLDKRRLARVGAGNFHVFKRREVIGKPDMDVGLLLDVSGSMDSNMGVVWMAATVFGEALVTADGVNFLCLTYTGGFADVQTTLICSKEMGKVCLGNVDQGGGTPSGPAIATMKVHMDRMQGKKKVIIHFTDGSPDDRASVLAAVANCRKDGYEVWAIGLQGMESQLYAQYGEGKYQTISTIKELPAKVGELLKNLVIQIRR
ncbi:hypothetical protein LCGC14_1018990, partial [marine sediment metagenome]